MCIKKISANDDFFLLSQLLNDSFGTVAKEFNLTRENCPTNNAFISRAELKNQLTDCREFFAFEHQNLPVGFIAIERSERDPTTFYIEKVAVHPAFRHKMIGKKLMDFSIDRIKGLGGKRISIGLIAHHVVLKNWYQQQGFKEFELKSYEYLPFDVCMMEKYLS